MINRDCMSRNLLSCVIIFFNVEALHIFNVRIMMLFNGRRRSQWAIFESLWFEVGAFTSGRTSDWKEPRNSRRRLWDGRNCGTKADFRRVGNGRYDSEFECLQNEGSPWKARRDGGCMTDSGTYEYFEKSSWYLGYV